MPIHDWTRVTPGIFHHFHQRWVLAISDVLNAGLLPAIITPWPNRSPETSGPDVLALQLQDLNGPAPSELHTDQVSAHRSRSAPPRARLHRIDGDGSLHSQTDDGCGPSFGW
jgi:hypothetical protein